MSQDEIFEAAKVAETQRLVDDIMTHGKQRDLPSGLTVDKIQAVKKYLEEMNVPPGYQAYPI